MVGIAVVGAGRWGRNLVRNFESADEAELLYICDSNQQTRAAMAAQYPRATVTGEYEDLLEDDRVDGVVVSVDAPLHHRFAKAALEAGKHTYVEKPMTLRTEDSQDLVDLAAARGLKLMVGHLLEYHPAVAYLKRMVDAGEVGTPLYLYFQRVNLGVVRKDENAWWSLAPHDISVACHLFEAEPVSVSASGQAYLQRGVEDVVFANIKFADGRMAHIHVSWLDPHKIRKVTVVGSEKMVVFDDMEASEKIRIYDKGAEISGGVDNYAEAIALRLGDIVIPKLPALEPLRLECQHFVDCIREDRTPLSDGHDGMRVGKVLEAGDESLRRDGELIRLP
jgi:predicted dehydrogenase